MVLTSHPEFLPIHMQQNWGTSKKMLKINSLICNALPGSNYANFVISTSVQLSVLQINDDHDEINLTTSSRTTMTITRKPQTVFKTHRLQISFFSLHPTPTYPVLLLSFFFFFLFFTAQQILSSIANQTKCRTDHSLHHVYQLSIPFLCDQSRLL